MAIKYNIVFQILLALSLTFNVNAQLFDITKFGAQANGVSDSSKGLEAAWKAACASPIPSTVLIPVGKFLVSNVKLEGPCKAPIGIQLNGTLNAPLDQTKQLKGIEWISIIHVENFILNGGGIINGRGRHAWRQKLAKKIGFMLPTSLALNFLTNAVVEDITIKNGKMFQTLVFGSKNVTLQRVRILAPYDSPNTDGIHIGRSTGVQVLHSHIKTGDDCVSIGDGSRDVLVSNIHCGPGHGIAIGSLGKYPNEEPVSNIIVKSSSLTNTENGLRVKTWQNSPKGYTASDIHFEDITMTNVTYPINIDQEYCPEANCGTKGTPSNIKIDKLSFKGIRGTSSSTQIVKVVCSKSNPCLNVEIGDIDIIYNGPKGADTSICRNVNPKLTGRLNPSVCTSH